MSNERFRRYKVPKNSVNWLGNTERPLPRIADLLDENQFTQVKVFLRSRGIKIRGGTVPYVFDRFFPEVPLAKKVSAPHEYYFPLEYQPIILDLVGDEAHRTKIIRAVEEYEELQKARR
ncbi:hypothetical protein HYV21_01705 [Candidatus Microgenomates bacterium]|nr:hypothetical protein [Candidatus Microgenomates bacterium]